MKLTKFVVADGSTWSFSKWCNTMGWNTQKKSISRGGCAILHTVVQRGIKFWVCLAGSRFRSCCFTYNADP